MEPIYKGHPWDTTKWLLYKCDLLIEIVNKNGKNTIDIALFFITVINGVLLIYFDMDEAVYVQL